MKALKDKLMGNVLGTPMSAEEGRAPVFISYRQVDGSEAMEVVRRLMHTAGIPTWVDQDALFAGSIDENIKSVIQAGASGAVLIVSEKMAEEGNYVVTKELPTFIKLLPRGFWVAVVDAVTVEGARDPQKFLEILKRYGSVLEDQMRYQLDSTADRERLLKGLLGHRLEAPRDRTQIRVGVQTRPQPQGTNQEDLDFDFRLTSDRSSLPSKEDLSAFIRGVHLASERCHNVTHDVVVLSGGGQPGFAAALGAEFSAMRFPSLEVRGGNSSPEVWPITEIDAPCHTAQLVPSTPSGDKGDVAVLVQPPRDSQDPAFAQLAYRMAASYVINLTPGPGALPSGFIRPEDGAAVAHQVRNLLNEVYGHHRGRIHLCINSTFPMAVLIGRLLNTWETIVYDLAKVVDDNGRELFRRYVPLASVEAGRDDGALRSVTEDDFDDGLGDEAVQVINLTPHAVTLVVDGIPTRTWPPADEWARLDEKVVASIALDVMGPPADPDAFVRLGVEPPNSRGQELAEGATTATVKTIRYGGISNLPEPVPGVVYVVPRVLAERLGRPDVLFPADEARDAKNQIVGCRSFGRFPATRR